MKDSFPELFQVSTDVEFLLLESTLQSTSDAAWSWADAGLTARIVRGRKMRTFQGLFDEFAPALQFPWYFGENGHAFEECMSDLGWMPAQSGHVILALMQQSS